MRQRKERRILNHSEAAGADPRVEERSHPAPIGRRRSYMKVLKAHAWLPLVAVIMLMAPQLASANSGCNLGSPPSCACSGGCKGPTAVTTSSGDPCGTGGSFDMTKTQYAATCSG